MGRERRRRREGGSKKKWEAKNQASEEFSQLLKVRRVAGKWAFISSFSRSLSLPSLAVLPSPLGAHSTK